MFKKFLTEPLVHFLAIALVFFIVYEQVNSGNTDDNTITVSSARVEQMKQSFLTRWNREPVAEELSNAAQHYALNEMYLREARALKLDIGDKVIDRRLRQKMDFLLEDLVTAREPSEEELNQYYRENISQYQHQPKLSFSQVHMSIDVSPEQLAENTTKQKQRIRDGLAPLPELTLLPQTLIQTNVAQINRIFGSGFAEKLSEQPLNSWVGPIKSAQGQHFVFIEAKEPATDIEFSLIKAKVEKDWQYQNLQKAKTSFEQELMQSYQVDLATDVMSESE